MNEWRRPEWTKVQGNSHREAQLISNHATQRSPHHMTALPNFSSRERGSVPEAHVRLRECMLVRGCDDDDRDISTAANWLVVLQSFGPLKCGRLV